MNDSATKLDDGDDANGEDASDADVNGASASVTKPRKRKKRKSIGQQSRRTSKAKVTQQSDQSPSASAIKRGRPKNSAGAFPNLTLDDNIQQQLRQETTTLDDLGEIDSQVIIPSVEPTRGTGHTPYKKRKKRVSVGQQSRKKPRDRLPEVKEEPLDESGVTMHDVPEQQESEVRQVEDISELEEEEAQLDADDDEEEQEEDDADSQEDFSRGADATVSKTKRKKRKSIGQQRPKKTSRIGSVPIIVSKAGPRNGKQVQREAKRAKTDRDPRRLSPSVDSDLQAQAGATIPSKGRPAKAGRPKATMRPQKSANKLPSRSQTSRKVPANAIPITVYRDPSAPPEDSEDDDALTDPLRLIHTNKPKTFNAVDVLAQVTLERLSAFAHKFNGQPPTSRTQRKALELYTEEVEVRLRRLSRALDRSKGLSLMVKRLGKEERALKGQVKEIETRRKEVEEQMKEVEEKRKEFELGELLRRIGEVARKGWELERNG